MNISKKLLLSILLLSSLGATASEVSTPDAQGEEPLSPQHQELQKELLIRIARENLLKDLQGSTSKQSASHFIQALEGRKDINAGVGRALTDEEIQNAASNNQSLIPLTTHTGEQGRERFNNLWRSNLAPQALSATAKFYENDERKLISSGSMLVTLNKLYTESPETFNAVVNGAYDKLPLVVEAKQQLQSKLSNLQDQVRLLKFPDNVTNKKNKIFFSRL